MFKEIKLFYYIDVHKILRFHSETKIDISPSESIKFLLAVWRHISNNVTIKNIIVHLTMKNKFLF